MLQDQTCVRATTLQHDSKHHRETHIETKKLHTIKALIFYNPRLILSGTVEVKCTRQHGATA